MDLPAPTMGRMIRRSANERQGICSLCEHRERHLVLAKYRFCGSMQIAREVASKLSRGMAIRGDAKVPTAAANCDARPTAQRRHA